MALKVLVIVVLLRYSAAASAEERKRDNEHAFTTSADLDRSKQLIFSGPNTSERKPLLRAQILRAFKNNLEEGDLFDLCSRAEVFANLNISPLQGRQGQYNKHSGTLGTHSDSSAKQHAESYSAKQSANKVSDFTAYGHHDLNICECYRRIFGDGNVNSICDCLKSIEWNRNKRTKHVFFSGAKVHVLKSILFLFFKKACYKYAQSDNSNTEPSLNADPHTEQISSMEETWMMKKQDGINHMAATKHGTLPMNNNVKGFLLPSIMAVKTTIKQPTLLLNARSKRDSGFPHREITTTTATTMMTSINASTTQDSNTTTSKEEDLLMVDDDATELNKNDTEEEHAKEAELAYRSHTFMGLVDTRGAQRQGSFGGDDDSSRNQYENGDVAELGTEGKEGSNQGPKELNTQQVDTGLLEMMTTMPAVDVTEETVVTTSSSEKEVMLPEAFATQVSNNNSIAENKTNNTSIIIVPQPSESITVEDNGVVESLPSWDDALATWGNAWPLHIYTIGVLSALLAVYSFVAIICLSNRSNNLLSRPYFVLVNVLLSFLGGTRAAYFLTDPYNANRTFHPAAGYLLYGLAFPCLTSTFSFLFLALVQSTRMRLLAPSVIKPRVLVGLISIHFILAISADIIVGCYVKAYVLRLICQGIFVVWGLLLFCGYIALFNTLLSNARRNHDQSMRIGSPAKHGARPTLSRAVKLCFIIAVCGILAAGLQLYGMLSVFSSTLPKPWPWWGYTLTMRLIELIMCFTMSFVATQPLSQSCIGICRDDEDKPPNGAYHNGYYSGNSPDSADGFFPTAGDETFPMARDTREIIETQEDPEEGAENKDDTLRSTTASQRSRPLSMLVYDNGLIRFREDNDPASAAVMYSTDDELGSCGDIQPQDVFYECHATTYNKPHSVPNTGANTPLTPRSYYSADSEGAYSEAFSFRPPSSIHLRDSIDRALNYPHFTLRTPDFVETPDRLSRSGTPEYPELHNAPMSPPSGHHHRAHYDSRVYPSSQANVHRKSSLRCILNQLSRSRASSRHNSRSDDGSTVSLRAPRHRRLSSKDECKAAIKDNIQATDEV